MYTLTIIRISGGIFRGTMVHKQISKQGVLTEIMSLPIKESDSYVIDALKTINSTECKTITVNGDDQHWICYISNITK